MKKLKKRILIGTGIIILLAVIYILFLPKIMSSNWGKHFLGRMIEKHTGGSAKIGNISLSWFGDQKIESFQYEKEGETHLTFNLLESDCTFITLLMRSGSIGTTTLEGLHIRVQAEEKEASAPTASSEVTKTTPSKKKKGFWRNFNGTFQLVDGQLYVQHQGKSFFSMEKASFDLNVSKATFPLTIKSQGVTKQGELFGRFDVQAKVGKETLEGEVHIQNFPVEGMDQLVALMNPELKGILLGGIGDTLNLDFVAQPDDSSHNTLLQLRSPRLLVNLNTFYQNGVISLKDPARAAWTIKPTFLNYLIERVDPKLSFALQSDAKAEVCLQSGQIHMDALKFDWNTVVTQGDFYLSQAGFFLPKIQQNLYLDEFKVHFDTPSLNEVLNLNFQNSMRFGSYPQTNIQGSWMIDDVKRSKEDLRHLLKGLNLRIQNFSLSLVDQTLGGHTKWSHFLGSTLDLDVTNASEKLVVNASTPLCSLTNAEFEVDEHFELLVPATLTYQLQPSLLSQLASPVFIHGSLNQFNFPLKKHKIEWEKAVFDLSLNAHDILLTNLASLGELRLPEAHLRLKGPNLESVEFEAHTQLGFALNTWGYSLIGPGVDTLAQGYVNFKDEIEIPVLQVKITGTKFSSEVFAAVKRKALILQKPLSIDFLLEPEQINPILSREKEYPLLEKPTPLHIEIEPSTIPLDPAARFQYDLKGSGSIASLSMISPTSLYPFTFQNVDLEFESDGKKQINSVRLDAEALENNQRAGQIELFLESHKTETDLVNAPSRVKAQLRNLSSQIADAIFQTRGQLSDMIGPELNLHYDMQKQKERQNFDLVLESRDLNLNGSFTVKGKQVELKSSRVPLKIEWRVTEKAWNAFERWRRPNRSHEDAPFQIVGNSSIKLQVAPLTLPLKEEATGFPQFNLNLYTALFDADFHVQGLTLKPKNSQDSTQLDRLEVNLAKQEAGGPLTFKLQGNISPSGAKGKKGQVQGHGKLENFLTPNGKTNLQNLSTSIHATIKHLPTLFLDALAKLHLEAGFPPSAFLGETLNATFDADLKQSDGEINMNVDASACRATFSSLVKNGIVYLKEPLQAAMTITPELNRILAKNAKIVIVSMKHPITLVVHDKGFAVPLKDFHLRSTSFSYGRLDLDQIVCRNTGSTSDVSSIFKMDAADSNTISLWFAPMELSMDQGRTRMDRTEILYNRAYQVALWGDINFRKRFVDMVLGLTAQSLKAALGIRDLSSDYVLTVPVRGPFGNVQVDKGAATGKIAFLIGRKKIAPQAGIWGSVLGAIGDMADDQSDIPPAKPPFPWQGELNMRDKSLSKRQMDRLSRKKGKAYMKDLQSLLKDKESTVAN